MIDIFTHSRSAFALEYWKSLLRTATRKYSGPQAVRDSLVRGLREHDIPFMLDPQKPINPVAVVLSGTTALKEQIERKRAGKIQTLFAGPNLVILPTDADGILTDPAIDVVLVPSEWVAAVYRAHAPSLAPRLRVWPAGVAVAGASTREPTVLVYDKRGDERLQNEVLKYAAETGYTTKRFTYGSFTQREYLEALERAMAVVYISSSESQGLALQEAWIRDVPTFVHWTGTVTTDTFSWTDDRVNAPHLRPEFGAFFKETSELASLLKEVPAYHPRALCTQELSDYASTETLLTLISA